MLSVYKSEIDYNSLYYGTACFKRLDRTQNIGQL
jgi:hypothetical protein